MSTRRATSTVVPRAALALLVLGAAVAATPGVYAAAPKMVKIPAAVVYRTAEFPAANDPHRCLAVAFAQYPTVARATSYSVRARGHKGSSDVSGGGPPFKQDTFKVTSGRKSHVFKVPGGEHWFVLGTSSTGQGCEASLAGLTGRFSIARATATV